MDKKIKIILILVAVVLILVIAWYLLSPLFIDKVVNEEAISNQNSNEEVQVLFSGIFQDADNFHKTSGDAKIISQGDLNYLRFENFETTNGPDLKVYFSNDLEAQDYVSLGELKGNLGNQNYELQEINYENYDYVLIWCEAFRVLFGYAEINS